MNFLLQRVVLQDLPAESHENRTRLGMLAGWVSVVISIFMGSGKLLLGMASGSVSMLADATNNFTDAGSSLVIALGFQWSRKPRDEAHPFGHGRIEAVATLVLSLALVLVGAEVGRTGFSRLINPQPVEAPLWVLVMVGVTVAVKAWMAVFARQLARLTKSKVLEADAWNHAFDIVCTLMVLGALLCSRYGWGAVDGWTAIGVAAFILYTGISFAREAIDILLGKRPDPETVREIHDVVLEVDGVMGVHEIMVHHYGDVKMVSFHVEVDARMSLVDAHLISEDAEATVEKTFNWRALAHLDPVDRSHPFFDVLSRCVHEYLEQEDCLVDAHDLRAEGEHAPFNVSFDLVTDMETSRAEYDGIYERALQWLERRIGGQVSGVEIGIEAAVESAPMARREFQLPSSGK
ncbi:cation diffusion facilitator family transporter [Pontiella sp. NLcol2]|uniref:Cation diffusion facilitator family transporter n=2 Tax=Pontiella agarivorans TaxID=3038953 RepID=A0ABU5MSS4_9BACT|nr:cation diffusion facilitator family transporter [Pontiella agarivorans]